jgi:hypothetical protein
MTQKLCPQAQAMLANAKRAKPGKQWEKGSAAGRALATHVDNCSRCGRDLEGQEWPPR